MDLNARVKLNFQTVIVTSFHYRFFSFWYYWAPRSHLYYIQKFSQIYQAIPEKKLMLMFLLFLVLATILDSRPDWLLQAWSFITSPWSSEKSLEIVKGASPWQKYEIFLHHKSRPVWDLKLPLRNPKIPYLGRKKYHMYVPLISSQLAKHLFLWSSC